MPEMNAEMMLRLFLLLEAHAENATRNFNHMFYCAVSFSTVS